MRLEAGDYYTLSELSKETRKDENTIKVFLFRHKIPPITSTSLYPATALDKLRKAAKPGRPSKKR